MMQRHRGSAWLGAAILLLLSSGCDESPNSSQAIHMLRSGLDKAAGGVVVELDLSHGLSEKPPQFSLLSGSGAPTYARLLGAAG
jgi:hypothetical protein